MTDNPYKAPDSGECMECKRLRRELYRSKCRVGSGRFVMWLADKLCELAMALVFVLWLAVAMELVVVLGLLVLTVLNWWIS